LTASGNSSDNRFEIDTVDLRIAGEDNAAALRSVPVCLEPGAKVKFHTPAGTMGALISGYVEEVS